VTAGTNVQFPIAGNPVNNPPGSKITMQSAGVVNIADSGFYQVTFGAQPSASATSGLFELKVNGASPVTGVGSSTLALDWINATNTRFMQSITTIIEISNPSTLTLTATNTTTIHNGSATLAGGPAAYMTIIKLR
jgi:hypothetical protein